MNRSIPNINTARLTLRAMKPQDFERFAEIWADPMVVRNLGGVPWNRGKSWSAFLRNAGHWQMTGFGQWAITEQNTRRMIGQTGFFFGARALGEDFDPYPEAGWLLVKDAQGLGFGTEAAQAAHDWFDRVIPGPLVAMVETGHTSSLRVAAKLGYEELREAEFEGDSVVLLFRNGPPHRS